MSKIMNVYYGQDTLPYKDKACSVHFPIIGQSFAGSSLVDAIKFYVDKIGGINDIEWLAVVKRADGTFAYQQLEGDSDSDGVFVTLPLSSYYTEKSGDLYITLNGYQGGIEVTEDELNIWHVNGTPIVQVVGAVKLTIAYAPVLPQDISELETISIQEALGLVASKLDKDSPYFLKVVNVASVGDINNSPYGQYLQNGDVFYEKNSKKFYKITSGSFGTFVAQEIEFVVSALTVGTLTASSVLVSEFNDIESTQEGQLGTYVRGLVSPKADKTYVDTQLGLKADKSDTYTKAQVDSKVDAVGHSIDLSIDTNYDIVLKLLDKNGNVISQDDIDLPLESIVTSATYYDTYTYDGTTYTKVIVITLATTDVPTIVPVGDLVNGLVSTTELQTALANYYTKTQVDTNKVDKTFTIAGISLSSNISAQELTDALIYASNSDIEGIMED